MNCNNYTELSYSACLQLQYLLEIDKVENTSRI